jgi:hypothetical protein
MRVAKIAILSGALSVMGFAFASPASACKDPVNNNSSCEWGGCHLVVEEPNPNGFGAPYFECYY